jgi:6-phosphogluconolactonase (cycloisomerase 2 family)
MESRYWFKVSVARLVAVLMVILPLVSGTTGVAAASDGNPGAVYTMTNSAAGNAIQEFDRSADGGLSQGGLFSTGGVGSGSGLGSQGAIVLGEGGRWLFAVNAGSSEISVFAVRPGQLTLVDKTSSAGSSPISLTYNRHLLYVLNVGNGGSIAGFTVSSRGRLHFIPGSIRPLSNNGVGAAPSPEEIAFTPDGKHLVVTEKGSNLIDTYNVENGRAHGPVVNASAGPAPYGFDFGNRNVLVVSEAANSAASSYRITDKGLNVISASVLDTQAAACWLIVTGSGKYAYAANAASGTVSGYRVRGDGSLSLLSASGVDGITGDGSHPIDMGISKNDRFLYVLASGNNTINAFMIMPDGGLSFIASYDSPAGASGLAAR